MTLLQIFVLSVVQGITEFLPISSSGHLVLVPFFTGWSDQGLLMDIAVHMGTLGAVILYFWRDVFRMIGGLLLLFTGRLDPWGKVGLLVILATLPVIAAGVLLKEHVETVFRSVTVIGWTTLGFGIALFVADRVGMTVRRTEHLTWLDALFIGLAQVLALIPGTSRSGITMTAGRLLGMERTEAARFSMLLSIPTILGAGVLAGMDLAERGDVQLTHDAVVAAGLAFLSALVAIWAMMAWLRRASFTPFVIYRLLLGGFLLWLVYGAGTVS